jgi:hypothetical protein
MDPANLAYPFVSDNNVYFIGKNRIVNYTTDYPKPEHRLQSTPMTVPDPEPGL